MLAKLSVDQALMKAKSCAKKDKIAEAQKLYETVLEVFPKNQRARHGLIALNKSKQILPEETLHQLVNLYNQGSFSSTVDLAQNLTKQYPDVFIVWNILGLSAAQIGLLDQAIIAFQKVIFLKPDDAEVYNNMGVALKDQSKLNESIEAFKKAVLLKPDYPEAYSNMGNALKDKGNLEEAIELYKKSISLNPDYADAYYNMGIALEDKANLEEAIEAYKKAVSLKPNNANAYYKMANALRDKGKLDEAIKSYKKALALKPKNPDALLNMGVTLQSKNKLDEAIEAYEEAILYKSDYAEAYINMGVVLKDQGKLDKAITAYKTAIFFKPDYAEAYNNMGITLHDQGKLDMAIEAYNKSISLKPDYAEAHLNLSFSLLNSGKLKEGLDKYEWRWKIVNRSSKPRHFSKPLWDGKKSLKGKRILLWSEQGIGDTINWSSYLSFVSSKADHCILECKEKVIPLLERSFPNVEIRTENRSLDTERNDFDFHLPIGSLCKYFFQEILFNNKDKGHLIPDPIRVKFWRERLNSLGNGPYVGISWKSSDISPIRLPNYAAISEWSHILNISDVIFINLQYKDFADDLAKIKDEYGVTVHNFDDLDHYNNLDDVAALCAALDIVVSTKITVPLISAGVGTSTKLANWKQSNWNNVLFNPLSSSVDIFERNTCEPWDNSFRLIAEDISRFQN